MTTDELAPILAAHKLWVRKEPGGVRAVLRGADMTRANLTRAGCWWGTIDELEARVAEVHGSIDHGRAYQAAIAFIRAYADSYWKG